MRTLACLQCCFMLLPSHTHRVTPTQYTLRAYLQLLDLRLQLALPMPLTCYVATCIGFVVVRSMRLRPALTVPCPELVTCIRAGEANGEGGARRDATCDPTCPPAILHTNLLLQLTQVQREVRDLPVLVCDFVRVQGYKMACACASGALRRNLRTGSLTRALTEP
jgi:hypothetical protein